MTVTKELIYLKLLLLVVDMDPRTRKTAIFYTMVPRVEYYLKLLGLSSIILTSLKLITFIIYDGNLH